MPRNATQIPDDLCTLATCTLAQAHFDYIPTLPGNALYTAIFSLAILLQLGLGIRYRTWGFLGGMFGGLVLEIIGYISRIQLHFNPFDKNPFLIYLICLTIAPAFFSAAIYLCLARIIVVYGENISRFSPRFYTITFIICDFVALCLQGGGGGIASAANDHATTQTGINIMIAGLGWQVASIFLFMLCCGEFAWRVYQSQEEIDSGSQTLRRTWRFKIFLAALGVATLAVFIRSCFRVAELSQGFHGPLANQEVTYMILEGAMIVIASIALTACHPGLSFAGQWSAANFTLKGRKKRTEGVAEEKVESERVSSDEGGIQTLPYNNVTAV
ncbi:hypothetical protein MMC30_005023 [Trapelia coarctata]|nr:hypothetical protein [Trapelia coarctata]